MRASSPELPDRAIAAALECFREREDGRVEPRLARHRHLQILQSLWEHRPSARWATLQAPTLLAADTGDVGTHGRQAPGGGAGPGGGAAPALPGPRRAPRCPFAVRTAAEVLAAPPARASVSAPRLLVVMGPGEMAPTMVRLIARSSLVWHRTAGVLLDT